MQHLTTQLQQGQTTHFMILHTMGTLATANIPDIITFIKPTLIAILPTLGMIKLDHVKQAYAFGKNLRILFNIISLLVNKLKFFSYWSLC